jgi:hypothetical protein
MSTPNYLSLNNGLTHWAKDSVSENLKYSIIDFYRWTFLNVGAYQNISISPAISGVYGGDRFRLSYVKDNRFTNGTVWQGFRSDWVWETGISFNPPPTSVNVVVNNVPVSSGYYVDYPRGRVVFDTPRPTGAVVQASFSHRTVSFVSANEPWFRELMFNSYEVQRTDFLSSNTGGKWSQFSETRRQLPVVGVEIVGTRGYKPYQIGGGQWQYQDILYYIYSENASERDKLRDIISDQNDKIIWLYDRSLMKQHSKWPFFLDYRGAPISGFWTYPSVILENNNLRFLNAKFTDSHSQNLDTNNDWLYGAVVRTTAEMINPYG